ncbi:hypothetical protein Tco_0667758 [Tanacetum coccineum]
MIDAQPREMKIETTQEQVVEDARVTNSTVTKKTEVPATSSSYSSDLASNFLNFSDIPHTNAEIISPLDVHVHHEVLRTQEPTLLTIPVFVISKSSPSLIEESPRELTLAKVSSQPHSTYEAASTLTEFELKKILIDKMEKSESYLAAPNNQRLPMKVEKTYDLDKDFFFSYDVYALKRGRKDKDKDEDPSTGSDRGLKNRKTSKDAEPTTAQKKKDSTSDSSKGTKIETATRCDWFKKPTPPQEPTDLDSESMKLQLGVERYQRRSKSPSPDTIRRLRLTRSDELYKFSDGTLTRLLSSLEETTKNIDMEYLPKRRWSTLEKKIAHFMINDINKLLKERRMMRSLEKFVGGRLYGTDLRLLQRTI